MLFNRIVQVKVVKEKDVAAASDANANNILIVEPEKIVVLAGQALVTYMLLDTFRKCAIIWVAK